MQHFYLLSYNCSKMNPSSKSSSVRAIAAFLEEQRNPKAFPSNFSKELLPDALFFGSFQEFTSKVNETGQSSNQNDFFFA